MNERRPAVAGTWYPGTAGALATDVDDYLDRADPRVRGSVRAIIAPHAGLMFSGPVAAWAYKAAAASVFDVVVLVGPSHFVGFEGVSVWPRGAFGSPFGPAAIDEAVASAILASPIAAERPDAHAREHSLEMQLPFVRRLFPALPIVPIVVGYQVRETIDALGEQLARAVADRQALLVASTDLSHYFDAATADRLDGRVRALVDAFDSDGLLSLYEEYPERERGRYVACGGGAAIAVMRAAQRLGARDGRVLHYAHSGHVSGDNEGVVGYLAAAFGSLSDAD